MRFNSFWCGLVAGLVAVSGFAADTAPTDAAKPVAGKSYQIKNKKFGDLLRPEDAKRADGTPIVLYPAQSWKCMTWKVSEAGDAKFALQNHFTSKSFAAKAIGDQAASVAVVQVPFGKTAEGRPVWEITKLKDGTYKIVEAKTGKALTAQKGAGDSEVKIVLAAWNDGDEQKWELQEIDPAKLTM